MKSSTPTPLGKFIPSLLIALSIVILGLCLKSGIDNFTFRDREVTVRGLAERLADALAHFARRRVGERDDQHVFNRAALAHELHDALHQHGRLARARRRADDQAVPPVGDGEKGRLSQEGRPRLAPWLNVHYALILL